MTRPEIDQTLDRIDAENPHGVDFLADGARAKVSADRGGARSGNHEHGDDGPELGDGAERGARTGQVSGADLAQQDVERESHQNGERNRHQQRGNQ